MDIVPMTVQYFQVFNLIKQLEQTKEQTGEHLFDIFPCPLNFRPDV